MKSALADIGWTSRKVHNNVTTVYQYREIYLLI